jgi:O-antigen biosynthesis alpha-1,3-rhamnosyltransferase
MLTTSIIIPTLNADSSLETLLQALKGQTVTGEIIVVDSSSSDRTVDIARTFDAWIIMVRQEDFDHGGTRTFAGKTAKGDILVYLTQDALPSDAHTLKALVTPFINDSKLGAVYGRQLPYPDATPFAAHLRLFNYPHQSYTRSLHDKNNYGIKTAFLSNSFAAYRKRAIEEIGWFKSGLISTEDTYAGAKLLLAGYRLAYAADAIVYHSHNYTLFQEFKRYFDIGVFHKMESWIREAFGKAEGEGMKYLKSEMAYLIKMGKYHLFPELFIRNALKYIGYSLGGSYKWLPGVVIREMSMNREWWHRADSKRD